MNMAVALLACALTAPGLAQSPSQRTVHVFVALADNVNQGIVPVPPKLGKGDDPEHNLYWGAAAGVKTFFARSTDWQLISQRQRPKPEVLERCIFKHRTANVYLVADAYQGNRIQQAITDFLSAAAGDHAEEVRVRPGTRTPQAHGPPLSVAAGPANDKELGTPVSVPAGGAANLVAYIGHDGFMDFQLPSLPRQKNTARREAIVLACISKTYFAEAVRASGAHPLLWTTGLMAPEAYTLKDALDGWVAGENDEQIRERAARAYDRYQKCGIKGARRLFASGW
ncbi:MAG TPA: hypothetical protein VKE93_01165 [Candidatus Angelobacter sp.]|nr:hypothetical protein [Candidatus Angelobacter sp.]